MIRIRDAFVISLTKLKVRRIRLIITIIIAALLFALLNTMVIVVEGALQSAKTFNNSGLSNKFMAAGTLTVSDIRNDSTEVIAKVESEYAAYVLKKQQLAKELGIPYSEKEETPWVITDENNYKYVNYESRIAFEKADDIVAQIENNISTEWETQTQKYGAVATYQLTNDFSYSYLGGGPYIKVLKDNTEQFNINKQSFNPIEQKGFANIESTSPRIADDAILKPFLLDGQSLDSSGDDIPVFIPFSVAEEGLGLEPLGNKATDNERIERIKSVKSGIAGKQINICYRTARSAALVQMAINQAAEKEASSKSQTFTTPAIEYGLPTTPCGKVPIVKDTRTQQQIVIDDKQDQLNNILNNEKEESRIITLRVVGVLPDLADLYSNSITSILSSVLSSSIGYGWIVPTETLDKNEQLQSIIKPMDEVPYYSVKYIAEFSSQQDLRTFIQDRSCDIGIEFTPFGNTIDQSKINDNLKECINDGKRFTIENFGNNAAAIADFKEGFYRAFKYISLVVALVSGLILMGIIGKIIADARKETAVFRALGAKRIDIVAIYSLYTLLLGVGISIAAFVIGMCFSLMIHAKYSPLFTPKALLIFNANDTSLTYSFIGIDITKLITIVFIVIITCLIGMAIPLVSNVNRSPIKDMREEN